MGRFWGGIVIEVYGIWCMADGLWFMVYEKNYKIGYHYDKL